MIDGGDAVEILKAVMRGDKKSDCPEAQDPEGSALWDSIAANVGNAGGVVHIPSDFPDMSGTVYHKLPKDWSKGEESGG